MRDSKLVQRALDVPIYRSDDPSSSRSAAEEVTGSGRRQRQIETVLALVRAYPGKTSLELALLGGVDRYIIARRLPELEEASLVTRGSVRLCTSGNRPALSWYPVKRKEDNGTAEQMVLDYNAKEPT
jgi:hypothetical protein